MPQHSELIEYFSYRMNFVGSSRVYACVFWWVCRCTNTHERIECVSRSVSLCMHSIALRVKVCSCCCACTRFARLCVCVVVHALASLVFLCVCCCASTHALAALVYVNV